MPGRCARARSLTLVTKHFQFYLKLHIGLFYECDSPDSVWTYQCLASISGKLGIARRVNSKMAGTNSGKLQIALRKNGCQGDVLRQDH